MTSRGASQFVDRDLSIRLEHAEGRGSAAFVDARRELEPGSIAEWTSVDGAYAMFDGPDSPLTQTFGLGLGSRVVSDSLDRLELFFRERSSPTCHEVSPLAGESVFEELQDRGYRAIELTSVMFRELQPGTPPSSPSGASTSRLRTRRIDHDEADIWAATAAAGWRLEAPELVGFLEGIGRVNARRADASCFLAECDGQPAAAGLLCVNDGVALLAGASTRPEMRRRGAQNALLDARLDFARAAECDVAMMCARPGSASQRNAERQGFRIAYTRIKWELRAGSDV